MKCYVLYPVIERKYYLSYYMFQHYNKLEVDSYINDKGEVGYSDSIKNHEVLFTTKEFSRELQKGEHVQFEDKNYTIVKVSHNEDGSINYYINKDSYIYDEESKLKAKQDLELRKEFLKKRKLKEDEDEAEIKRQQEEFLNGKKKNGKWYEFWK